MRDLIVSNRQLPSIKEGVIKGLEIASGAKSSATHYHKKADQVNAVRNAVANLYGISKELPLLLANQKGTTGFFIQEVILNELKNTEKGGSLNIVNPADWYDEGLSNKAILGAIRNLDTDNGIPYVLRLFTGLRENKINNARTRRLALSFIWGHPNIEFVAVKYRNKLRTSLQHIYGQKTTSILLSICKKYVNGGVFDNENSRLIANKNLLKFSTENEKLAKVFLFLFGKSNASMFGKTEFPVINQFYAAKTDITGCNLIPEEVLVGLIGDKSHPQYRDLWNTPEKRENTLKDIRNKTKVTTANQAVRQTKKNAEIGVTKQVNVEQVTDFLALYKTGYEAGFNSDIRTAIDKLAEKKKFNNFMYSNVGVVIDKSNSMTGHKQESKNTPRAIAEFTAEVLKKSSKDVSVVETGLGSTDIAGSFLKLVGQKDHDAIFVLSDGYENSYDGLLDEVVKAWRELTGSATPIYHVSPIVGSEMNAKVRPLGKQISSMAVSKPEGILMQLNSKLLEQDTKVWLKNQFQLLLNK